MPATLIYNAAPEFPAALTPGADVTHLGFWSEREGGVFYGSIAVSNDPAALALHERWGLAAGQIVLTIGDGDMQAPWAKLLAELAATQTIYLSAHTALPDDEGSDEASYTGYTRVALMPAHWVTAQT